MENINLILKVIIQLVYVFGLIGFLNIFVEKKFFLKKRLFKNNKSLKKIMLIIIFILFEGICATVFHEKANNDFFKYFRLAIFLFLLIDDPTKK